MSFTELDNLIPNIEYFANIKASNSWKAEKSTIDNNNLTFVYGGCATYIVNDEKHCLNQGDFIYTKKGSTLEAYTNVHNPMQAYCIDFNCFSTELSDIVLPIPQTFRVGTINDLSDLFKDLDRTWSEKNQGYMFKARGLFILIIHKIIDLTVYNSSYPSNDVRIQKVKEYILTHYPENIFIDDLADLVGLNPLYLGVLFKKYNNCSIKEYINKVRINVAENLLNSGRCPVNEAGHRCGFNDIFYFSKVFKQFKGYPPSYALKSK